MKDFLELINQQPGTINGGPGSSAGGLTAIA